MIVEWLFEACARECRVSECVCVFLYEFRETRPSSHCRQRGAQDSCRTDSSCFARPRPGRHGNRITHLQLIKLVASGVRPRARPKQQQASQSNKSLSLC